MNSQIWPKILLFLVDGIAGYGLQFFGYAMSVFIFNNRKINVKTIVFMTAIFSFLAFVIRKLPISFGIHTILIMITTILVSYLLFKFELYPTVFAVLFCIVSILLFELLTVISLNLILGKETFNLYFEDKSSTFAIIRKTLMGVPQNIFLCIEMVILYFHRPKILDKVFKNGKISN